MRRPLAGLTAVVFSTVATAAIVAPTHTGLSAQETFGPATAAQTRGLDFVFADIDISGSASIGALGSPANVVLTLDIASALGMSAGSEVTIWGLAWEGLRLATNGPSWLSDATMYLDDAVAPDEVGVFLRPGAEPDETPAGVGNNRPGVATYSSGGFHLLEDFGLAPMTLPDGVLRLEFYEVFDDVLGLPDATWTAGTVTLLAIPAPGPVALCALAAGISATRRRR